MRLRLALTACFALFAATALAVPALGGPSLPAIAKKAAMALKLAKAADARSKRALKLAGGGAGTAQPGKDGGNGTMGPAGPQGPAGPAGAQKIDFRAGAGTGDTKVFDAGGLVLTASCGSGPNLTVKATSTVAASELHVSGVTQASGQPAQIAYEENDHLGPGNPGVTFPSGNFEGTFTFSTPAGAIVSGTVASEQTAFNGTKDCWFGGWALRDPS